METQSTSYHSDKQIAQRFKVSRATIWRWAKEGVADGPPQSLVPSARAAPSPVSLPDLHSPLS